MNWLLWCYNCGPLKLTHPLTAMGNLEAERLIQQLLYTTHARCPRCSSFTDAVPV